MLRDIRAQRAAIRHYRNRAKALDVIAHELNAAHMPVHARKAEFYAWVARVAAAREDQPEGGA